MHSMHPLIYITEKHADILYQSEVILNLFSLMKTVTDQVKYNRLYVNKNYMILVKWSTYLEG